MVLEFMRIFAVNDLLILLKIFRKQLMIKPYNYVIHTVNCLEN